MGMEASCRWGIGNHRAQADGMKKKKKKRELQEICSKRIVKTMILNMMIAILLLVIHVRNLTYSRPWKSVYSLVVSHRLHDTSWTVSSRTKIGRVKPVLEEPGTDGGTDQEVSWYRHVTASVFSNTVWEHDARTVLDLFWFWFSLFSASSLNCFGCVYKHAFVSSVIQVFLLLAEG